MFSLLAGGVTGLIGSLVNKGFDFFQKKQEYAQEEKRFDREIKLLELQAKQKGEDREADMALEEMRAELAAFKASIEGASAARGESSWVLNVKGLMRPALTAGSMLVATALFFFSGDGIGEVRGMSVHAAIVDTMLYLMSLSTSWWFGDRGLAKRRAG
tara:strand:- start:6531 stop:7004 length:474 start_codon:yes stop_codon:yes gene_type:complete